LKISAILAFLGFGGVFFVITTSQEIVGVLLNEEWEGMAHLIDLLGLFFLFEVSVFPGAILLSQGKSFEYFWLMTSAKTLTMLLMGVGVYNYGVQGLIYGMVLSGALSFIPYLYFSGKYVDVSVKEFIEVKYVPLLLAIISFISSYYLSSVLDVQNSVANFILKALSFGFVYLIGNFLVKPVGFVELKEIAFKKIKNG
jgi:O-antigen/teichoic acid export membrane protein